MKPKLPKTQEGKVKSAQARARKLAVKRECDEKLRREAEDRLWVDDDKLVQRKLKRREEKERKHNDKVQKREETRQILLTEASPANKPVAACDNESLKEDVTAGSMVTAVPAADGIEKLSGEENSSAYQKFVEKNMKHLKKEHPDLSHGQLHQLLKKEFKRTQPAAS